MCGWLVHTYSFPQWEHCCLTAINVPFAQVTSPVVVLWHDVQSVKSCNNDDLKTIYLISLTGETTSSTVGVVSQCHHCFVD